MKKYIYILLILLPLTAFADLGNTYIFKAKFVMKNGENFIGYYEINDYESLESYKNDKDFQKLLTQESRNNNYNVNIIKKYYVEPKTNFAFVNEREVVNLRVDDIKFTIFYTAFIPNYFNKTLNIVSNTAFTTIKNSKNLHFIHYRKEDTADADAYVFAINPTRTWKETASMSANLCEYLMNIEANRKTYTSEVRKAMEASRKEFEKQNIFIITYFYPC